MRLDNLQNLRWTGKELTGHRIVYVLGMQVFAFVDFNNPVSHYNALCYAGIDELGNPVYVSGWIYGRGTETVYSQREIILFRREVLTAADVRMLDKKKELILSKLPNKRKAGGILMLQGSFTGYVEDKVYY